MDVVIMSDYFEEAHSAMSDFPDENQVSLSDFEFEFGDMSSQASPPKAKQSGRKSSHID